MKRSSKMVVLAFILTAVLLAILWPEYTKYEYESQTIKKATDARLIKLKDYFKAREMPLENQAEKFIEVADRLKLDWRLLPAIAIRESSGGKKACNNNPFGWGSCKIKFKSFEEAIEVVGDHLAGNRETTKYFYKDKTIRQKLKRYNCDPKVPKYATEVIRIMKMISPEEIKNR